ncbi:GIY-YIG nuclease family protein [Novosphingobium sp. ST904]|uniref:GIY-YIG nuclease family protein n=1 Tax=Novosphingobium sp. ST904 TaxID=1684385 RepID=UPI000A796235
MKDTFAPGVYILASACNGTLYTGTTSNLIQRIAQHRSEYFGGFSYCYGTKLLVWFEAHATMEHAIQRERSGSRKEPGLEAPAGRGAKSRVARSRQRFRFRSVVLTGFPPSRE